MCFLIRTLQRSVLIYFTYIYIYIFLFLILHELPEDKQQYCHVDTSGMEKLGILKDLQCVKFCLKICACIFMTSSFQSSVSCENYSNCYLSFTSLKNRMKEFHEYNLLCVMLVDKLKLVFLSALLIFKESPILVFETNNCIPGKATYQ